MNLFVLVCIICVTQIAAFAPAPTSTKPAFARSQIKTERYNIVDVVGSMIQNFGKKARASHILIGPKEWDSEQEAKERLVRLKDEIGNDAEKFADAAASISSCPSSKKGGDLGEFGPGQMVRDFDKCVFNEDVGVVHGPIATQFGQVRIKTVRRRRYACS